MWRFAWKSLLCGLKLHSVLQSTLNALPWPCSCLSVCAGWQLWGSVRRSWNTHLLVKFMFCGLDLTIFTVDSCFWKKRSWVFHSLKLFHSNVTFCFCLCCHSYQCSSCRAITIYLGAVTLAEMGHYQPGKQEPVKSPLSTDTHGGCWWLCVYRLPRHKYLCRTLDSLPLLLVKRWGVCQLHGCNAAGGLDANRK